ncbi:cell division transport system permease protein [Azospirillaceae bacterium]
MIFRQYFDLPLAHDPVGRFLSWIVGVMVFLAVLALVGAWVLADAARRWDRGLAGTLTVQIDSMTDARDSTSFSGSIPGLPPGSTPSDSTEAVGSRGAASGASSSRLGGSLIPVPLIPVPKTMSPPVLGTSFQRVPDLPSRVEIAAALLRATPGVARAEPLSMASSARLLEPWLGEAIPDDLPLPALIDVVLAPGASIDIPALSKRLAAAAPGARVDDHAVWLADLRRLARAAQGVALLVVVLVAGAGVAAVVYSVRAGLAIHQPVVELLHIIGATDDYVARQFQAHVFRLAFRGAVVGALGAGGLLFGAQFIGGQSQVGLLPDLAVRPLHWTGVVLAPMAACFLTSLTARWTVLRALAALP